MQFSFLSPTLSFPQFCLHPIILSCFAPFFREKSEGSTPMNTTPPNQQITHNVAPQIGTNSWPNATILSVDTEELIFDIPN